MNIDYELRNNFINRRVALFCGAGFSANFSSSKTWIELISDAYQEAGEDINKYIVHKSEDGRIHPSELIRLAEAYDTVVAARKDKTRLADIICREFSDLVISRNSYIWTKLSELPIDIFITTNYDLLIEKLFNNNIDVVTFPHIITENKYSKKLYKIHGSVDDPENIIINESDYHKFYRDYKYFLYKLYTIFYEYNVIFVGYSLGDPNINYIYNKALMDYQENAKSKVRRYRKAYLLIDKAQFTKELYIYYIHKNIYLIKGNINDLILQLEKICKESECEKSDISKFFSKNSEYMNFLENIIYNYDCNELGMDGGYSADQIYYDIHFKEDEIKDFSQKILQLISNDEYINKIVDLRFKSFTKSEIKERMLDFINIACSTHLSLRDDDILRMLIDYMDSPLEKYIRNILKKYLNKYPDLLNSYKSKIIDNILRYNSENTTWADYPQTLKTLIDFSALGVKNQRYIDAFSWAIRRTGYGPGESYASVNILKSNIHMINPDFLEDLLNYDKKLFRNKKYALEKY